MTIRTRTGGESGGRIDGTDDEDGDVGAPQFAASTNVSKIINRARTLSVYDRPALPAVPALPALPAPPHPAHAPDSPHHGRWGKTHKYGNMVAGENHP